MQCNFMPPDVPPVRGVASKLWDSGACAPSTSNNFILVHFRVNLTANYPSIM